MNLKVKEIFYSLQGEGGRQGEASVFIRLAGCNLDCSFCDTDYQGGISMKTEEIISHIRQFPSKWIIWTGGEPTLQLTDKIIDFFHQEGYLQAIESNGTNPLPLRLDYRVISPKGEDISYARKNNPEVEEVRIPMSAGAALPDIETLPTAKCYYLSPIFETDTEKTRANIDYCVEQVKQHPRWRLSLQVHKLIGIE